MNLPEKRSLSSPLPVNKRLKLESSPRKWKAGPTPAPTFSSSNTRRQREPTRGTESVRLPSRNPSNAEVNNLILKITGELARAGKRLVHAPKLMTDGILFDWVLDFSAKEEDIARASFRQSYRQCSVAQGHHHLSRTAGKRGQSQIYFRMMRVVATGNPQSSSWAQGAAISSILSA